MDEYVIGERKKKKKKESSGKSVVRDQWMVELKTNVYNLRKPPYL